MSDYMDYNSNTSAALANEFARIDGLSKDAYAAADQLRNHHKDAVGDLKAIITNMSAVGDRLMELSDEFKRELFERYSEEYGLRKATDEEIIDPTELYHADHFEDWINMHRTR